MSRSDLSLYGSKFMVFPFGLNKNYSGLTRRLLFEVRWNKHCLSQNFLMTKALNAQKTLTC